MKNFYLARTTSRFKLSLLTLAGVTSLFFSVSSSAVVSSNTGPDRFTGTYINEVVNADTFYNQGYTGSRTVVLSVDAGHIWNQHETLDKVTTFLDARSIYNNNGLSFGELGDLDAHASSVAHMLAGNGQYNVQKGIAYGAELWSGAIATEYITNTNSFFISQNYAFSAPYEQALITGVNGRTADVVNGSYGFFGNANQVYARALDGMLVASRATSVVSAGNDGSLDEAVTHSPSGYNSIVVGALGSDQTGYNTISGFSSNGPQDYVSPTGTIIQDVRARVDIVAPGQNLTLATYGGTTGLNKDGTDTTGGSTSYYSSNYAGTSYASPTVAGAATLLNDVAYDQFANNANARDGQVIKAVLLNSANKLAGWDNGQQMSNNIITTTQALDYAMGAGALDLNSAFEQFTTGTTDVNGFGGGAIESVGWDYGIIFENSFVDYSFTNSLAAGETFTATLNWFVGRGYQAGGANGQFQTSDNYFTDLGLELYLLENGGSTLVAQSNAEYINTEHFSFMLQATGDYFLRVNWEGELYDFQNNQTQSYGLAWSAVSSVAAVPEPSTWMMLLAGCLFVLRKRQSVQTTKLQSI